MWGTVFVEVRQKQEVAKVKVEERLSRLKVFHVLFRRDFTSEKHQSLDNCRVKETVHTSNQLQIQYIPVKLLQFSSLIISDMTCKFWKILLVAPNGYFIGCLMDFCPSPSNHAGGGRFGYVYQPFFLWSCFTWSCSVVGEYNCV